MFKREGLILLNAINRKTIEKATPLKLIFPPCPATKKAVTEGIEASEVTAPVIICVTEWQPSTEYGVADQADQIVSLYKGKGYSAMIVCIDE